MDPNANLGEVVSDLVTGQEIDYRPKTYEHGTYRFNRLLPVQGPLNVSLSATNVTTTTIELPAKVFNLAKSVLRFTMQSPWQGNSPVGQWFHADTIACIDRLSLFTRSGVYICDLTNFNTYMKVTNKWTQSKEELIANDIGEPSAYADPPAPNATCTNGFQICNSAAANLPQGLVRRKFVQNKVPTTTTTTIQGVSTSDVVPALPYAAAPGTAGASLIYRQQIESALNSVQQYNNFATTGNQMPQALNATGTIDRTEQRYLFSVGRAETQCTTTGYGTMLNYLIKFGQIPHSIFSVDKDLYFGETLILQINWAPINRIGFRGEAVEITAPTDTVPSTVIEYHPATRYFGSTEGVGAVVAATATTPLQAVGGAINFQLNNVTCYLAVETNRLLIETIVRQMATSGLRMLVPYVTCNKYTSTAGITQNVQQRLNRAWGRTLLRVYHSAFNSVETEVHAYNNYNVGGANTVKTFYTTLDNDRLQEVSLDCATLDDYLFLQEMLKGTSFQSATHFQSNWSWIDDWTGRSPSEYKRMDIGECGLTLAQERLWQIYMTTQSVALNHYSFFVTQKMLTITPSQIMIV